MNVGEYLTYTYTGDVRTFTAPASGTYQLEVWGAQGGQFNNNGGGKGGYSKGEVALKKDDVLYIVIGGQGGTAITGNTFTVNGGYNGGSKGANVGNSRTCAGGGGATHIAKRTGLLYELENYKSDILIVAGGGGGVHKNGNSSDLLSGGTGGGVTGGDGTPQTGSGLYANGGTQTEGGVAYIDYGNGLFGKGGVFRSDGAGGGAGGGYYGGAVCSYCGGAGGSGYIGGVANGVTENGTREGDGCAVITLLSKDIAGYVGTVPFEAMYIGETEVTYIVGNGV